MRARKRQGCLKSLLGLLLIFLIAFYGVNALIAPWSFHIGGRWTPLLYWSGSGKLLTKGGTYPLYVSFFPSPLFSHLKLDGVRPSGGVRGSGSLCTSRGEVQQLSLSGTIYGGWRSTEDSLMDFSLSEFKIFHPEQGQGFTLYGRWHGPALVMDDRGEFGGTFHSRVKIEHASVTFNWGRYSDFDAACMSF